MRLKRTMTVKLCLSLCAALAVASVLLTHRASPAPELEGAGVVYVYFPSMCAEPGNPNDCHEIAQPSRPAFESMAACSAHADAQLRQEHNPNLMASCLRQREG